MASLAKRIDKLVADNQEKKLAAVINFTGTRTIEFMEQVKEFGEDNQIQHVALAVTSDGDRFTINDEAEITVMHYVGKKVAYNFAANKKAFDTKAIDKIIQGADTILK